MLTRWYGGKGRRRVAGGWGGGERVKGWAVAGERGKKKGVKGAERVAGGGGVRKCSERGGKR